MSPRYCDALWIRARAETYRAGEGDVLLVFSRLLRDDVLESAARVAEEAGEVDAAALVRAMRGADRALGV